MHLIIWIITVLYVFNCSVLHCKSRIEKVTIPSCQSSRFHQCRSRWSLGISTSAARILRSFPSSSRRRCSQPTAWVVPPALTAWATKTCRERSVLRRRSGMRVVRWMMMGLKRWSFFHIKFLKRGAGGGLREFNIISKPMEKSVLWMHTPVAQELHWLYLQLM